MERAGAGASGERVVFYMCLALGVGLGLGFGVVLVCLGCLDNSSFFARLL